MIPTIFNRKIIFIKKKTLYTLQTRSMITSVVNKTNNMELAKETFIFFFSHFSKISYKDLSKDSMVLNYFRSELNEKNHLCNRAFQLALEVSYCRKTYSRANILNNFKEYMSLNNILDPLDQTSPVDQSTVFSTLQSSIFKQSYPKVDIVVNQTPKKQINYENIHPTLKKALGLNERLTDNKFPDVHLNGIPHDYKNTINRHFNKNQIYMMSESEEAFTQFGKHLKEIMEFLTYNNQNIPREFHNTFKEKLSETLKDFLAAKSFATKHNIVRNWNNYIFELGDKRPKNFGTAVYLITKPSFLPDPNLVEARDKIVIPDGLFDANKVRNVMTAIVGSNPLWVQNTIYEATKGALGHKAEYLNIDS